MPEIMRTVQRSYRDDYESDDDRSDASHSRGGGGSRVHRYRVTPSRVEEVFDDDRRSSRLDVAPRGERIEVDRRSFVEVDRPRSAVESRPRSTYIERVIEREPIREPERETRRTVVYERDRREPENERPWERGQRPWEERDFRETDLTIVKRGERRDDAWDRERETDVRIEKKVERRDDDYDREIVRRETEYYDRPEPPPAPLIIRPPPAARQEIIFQEAPPPPPIVVAPREEQYQIVRQEIRREEPSPPEPRRREDEEYYYNRREVREIGSSRGREEDMAIAEYDRRDIRPRDSVSDGGYSDEDIIIRKKVIRRERSLSGSPRHKRHLAEGALAGAGIAALLANHKEKQGNAPEHRGRKVIGGAALGAIGAEVITRARSRYRESHDRDSRSRSRSSSRHSHRNVKTALGLAVAGLAAAAAAKYVSNRNANKEEDGRGRSRNRSVSRRRGGRAYYSDDDDYYDDDRHRSVSKHTDPKHRNATIAKAGAATAAVAGVAEYFRNKSRQRSGERSKSRIRTGAEIAGAGLAGAAVAGLYENRKAKEEANEADKESRRRARRRSRSLGTSRSRARSVGAYSDPGVDPELGMVQYGSSTVPVYPQQPAYPQGYDYDPAATAASGAAAGTAYGATRGSGSRSRRRHRDSSFSSDDQRARSRSRSRARDIAGVAAGTAAAAIGINQYKKRKEKKEAERERERRRYEEEVSASPPENYYARRNNYRDNYSPSPPHASGGYYNDHPEQPSVPYQGPLPGFTAHDNQSALNVNQPPIPPYNPQDYAGQAPPTTEHDPYAGYPPPPRPSGENVSANTNLPRQPLAAASSVATPYFPRPPTTPLPDEQLHHENRASLGRTAEEGRLSPGSLTPSSTAFPSPPNSPSRKSVKFGPLSPTSSRSLAKIHQNAASAGSSTHLHDHADSDDDNIPVRKYQTHDPPDDTYDTPDHSRHRRRRRRNSDPSYDRPNQPSKHRQRYNNPSRSPSPGSEDEVEVLPDRFDKDGRPLDKYGNSYSRSRVGGVGGDKQIEMVEKLAHDLGDVMEGRKTWKDLLAGLVREHAGTLTSSDDGGSRDSGSPERRERRRRDRDRDR